MQSTDPENKKDVAIKTIKSTYLYPSPVVMEMALLALDISSWKIYQESITIRVYNCHRDSTTTILAV